MAENKQEKTPPVEEEKFHVDDLIARSTDFLGQPSHVVAGALHGGLKNFTLEEARTRVDKYLSDTAHREA